MSEVVMSLSLATDNIAVYFGTSYFVDYLHKLNLLGVTMGENIFLSFVNEVKNLGVILDSGLSLDFHISSILKRPAEFSTHLNSLSNVQKMHYLLN